jgi:hypothetical protein
MKEITNTARDEINSFQNSDLVIVWGGANDISKNNTKEAVKSISEFVVTNKDLNVVLINSPHRHDLLRESCVNNEVVKFNRQMKKIMKLQSKVKILELTLDRYHFTTHGLHLNSKGKKAVTQDLALVVQQFFNKKNIPPISTSIAFPWKDPPLNVLNIEIQDPNASVDDPPLNDTNIEIQDSNASVEDPPLNDTIIETQDTNASIEVNNPTSSYNHRRNCPVRKNPDFLWM